MWTRSRSSLCAANNIAYNYRKANNAQYKGASKARHLCRKTFEWRDRLTPRLNATCASTCKVDHVNLRVEFVCACLVMYTALCALYHIVYTESACMTGGTEFHRAAVVDQVAAQHTDQLRHLLWRYVTVAYAEGTEHCSFRCWQYIKRRCARVAGNKA